MATYGALAAFHQSARFRIPDETVDEMGSFLVSAGVDPDRWFCVTHFREGVYWDRPSSPFRDPQPEAFEDLAHFVIDDLGGQIVRIGDPSMSQFPEREGLIDLTNMGAGRFSHHLFAISRTRFMLASNSGPGICGSASPNTVFVIQPLPYPPCGFHASNSAHPRPSIAPGRPIHQKPNEAARLPATG